MWSCRIFVNEVGARLHGCTTRCWFFFVLNVRVYCVGLAMAEHASSKMDHLLLRFIIMSATLAFLLATLPLYSSERQIYIYNAFSFLCAWRTGRVVDVRHKIRRRTNDWKIYVYCNVLLLDFVWETAIQSTPDYMYI